MHTYIDTHTHTHKSHKSANRPRPRACPKTSVLKNGMHTHKAHEINHAAPVFVWRPCPCLMSSRNCFLYCLAWSKHVEGRLSRSLRTASRNFGAAGGAGSPCESIARVLWVSIRTGCAASSGPACRVEVWSFRRRDAENCAMNPPSGSTGFLGLLFLFSSNLGPQSCFSSYITGLLLSSVRFAFATTCCTLASGLIKFTLEA